MTLRLIHHVPPLRREGAQGGASRPSPAPLTRVPERDGGIEARCAAAGPPVNLPTPSRLRQSFSLLLIPLAALVVIAVLVVTAVLDAIRRPM